MANGSTSSMNRMKILTDKMKTPPGNKVTYDAKGYAINPGNKSIKELTEGTTVLPTVNVVTKSNVGYKKIGYKKGENPNKPIAKNKPILKKPVKEKGPKRGTSTYYANIADQFVKDYDADLKKEGWSIFSTKMKTHYMKEGMDYRQKASDEYDAAYDKYASDTTFKTKKPNKSDY